MLSVRAVVLYSTVLSSGRVGRRCSLFVRRSFVYKGFIVRLRLWVVGGCSVLYGEVLSLVARAEEGTAGIGGVGGGWVGWVGA